MGRVHKIEGVGYRLTSQLACKPSEPFYPVPCMEEMGVGESLIDPWEMVL